MLNFISWKEFTAVLIIATLLYYAWILGIAKFKSLRNPDRKWKPDPPLHNNDKLQKDRHIPENTTISDDESEADEKRYKKLEQLADELQDLILNQQENISREEMHDKLKSHISIYPELDHPPFRTAINNLIDRSVRDFDMLFSQQELDALWLTVPEEEPVTNQ